MRLTLLLCLVLLYGCGGGSGSEKAASAWTRIGTVAGVSGHYTPVVLMGKGIRAFSNTEDGRWGFADGTWDGVGAWQEAIANPVGPDHFIRTSGVSSDGTLALLHVGPCYGEGCVSGFVPATVRSVNGRDWEYLGRGVTPFGQYQSSSGAFVVGETYGGCSAWEDGTARRLVRMTAPLPCTDWSSDNKDMWPTDGDPQFCSAARTPEGIHMICADGFPAKRHVWVFSCDGDRWRVIESDAGTKGEKGTNLAFDGIDLHALTSGTHYSARGLGYGCQ